MLVYGGQAACDATVQTLEAHYARTDNATHTDNSLKIQRLYLPRKFMADTHKLLLIFREFLRKPLFYLLSLAAKFLQLIRYILSQFLTPF